MPGLGPEEIIELKHALTGLAEIVWSYYQQLKKQGFTDEEELRLAIGWQQSMHQTGGDT